MSWKKRVAGDLTIVLDVGKTLSKLTLWDRQGTLIERRTRANKKIVTESYTALDTAGIEDWMASTLEDFARLGKVGAIVPVGHGAAAALIRGGRLELPPFDYEETIPAEARRLYDAQRDRFVLTGSPALPKGLNLGAQLHWLEGQHPGIFDSGTTIVPWPQYWAWVLCGMMASEVTSLGCHSDLWRPCEDAPSSLAVTRGWINRLAPRRRADEVLGCITPDWVARTGLPADVKIYCGIHDSNAALLAARGFRELAHNESTVLSTGTWFVAMRSLGDEGKFDMSTMPECRDCLVNVDAFGKPVPSARFMGGREFEILCGAGTPRIDSGSDQIQLLDAAPEVMESGTMILPTMTPGFGPFPSGSGDWIGLPDHPFHRVAAVCLYLALLADASLDLIGAKERLLVEGRFGEVQLFVRALATLRHSTQVYVANSHNDVSYGALRLIDPSLPPPSLLVGVEPLPLDLREYKSRWHRRGERGEHSA